MLANQWHHPIADYIAPYLTWAGDGLTYGCFILISAVLRTSCRKILIMGSSFVCMSLVVQLLKHLVFAHMVRPIAAVPLDANLHLVNGVKVLTHLSFPSGHSASIFTLVSVIQLLSKSKKEIYSLMLVLLALMIAYSRMYLCQHFYTDIYVGALIGTLSTIVVYLVCMHFKGPHWFNRSVYFFIVKYGARWSLNKLPQK
ncbi:phosphatase PAP2 family protein [Candidatus Cardinium hertigii]|nr:phosphatase PAP2 family protein [Candidatus Cardinium hertigii]